MEDSFKELLYSQNADIEEPNVPSTKDEEPTELVNAEVEFILERSTAERRDVPIVAASLIDHALSTTKKSTVFIFINASTASLSRVGKILYPSNMIHPCLSSTKDAIHSSRTLKLD
ncbi:hypothetical protein K3495_g8363 [Podosphaera aphanis]|nr:hypothetical protein K3495_g8363 [Podosphaera aphanis]